MVTIEMRPLVFLRFRPKSAAAPAAAVAAAVALYQDQLGSAVGPNGERVQIKSGLCMQVDVQRPRVSSVKSPPTRSILSGRD